ncbi:ATP-binding cassette domain-containing protein [Vineibacter terrae]|uniref:ATP-binding cassette domain-containing protein n=1 Tax=Vineibacter terrae TaxID=2586908 RepID=UPI0038B4BC0C
MAHWRGAAAHEPARRDGRRARQLISHAKRGVVACSKRRFSISSRRFLSAGLSTLTASSTMACGHQLVETLRLHQGLPRPAARARAMEMLRLVHIADPARRLDEHPHHLCGGMRQRVMIAIAMACNPQPVLSFCYRRRGPNPSMRGLEKGPR